MRCYTPTLANLFSGTKSLTGHFSRNAHFSQTFFSSIAFNALSSFKIGTAGERGLLTGHGILSKFFIYWSGRRVSYWRLMRLGKGERIRWSIYYSSGTVWVGSFAVFLSLLKAVINSFFIIKFCKRIPPSWGVLICKWTAIQRRVVPKRKSCFTS